MKLKQISEEEIYLNELKRLLTKIKGDDINGI